MIQNLIFGVHLLISDFLAESLKANKNWQKRSLILQYRIKNILSQHSQNLTHLTNFPWNIFLVGVKKNIPLHSAFSRHRESKYLYIPVYLRKKMFVPETWEALIWWGVGLGWRVVNNFLKAARYLGLVKCFNFFISEIQLYFSILILPSIALKRLNFPDNLDFKGRIVAIFQIRSHYLSI